jgi:hypothetical protein
MEWHRNLILPGNEKRFTIFPLFTWNGSFAVGDGFIGMRAQNK